MKKAIPFTKMEGAANDYVYFDWRAPLPDDLEGFARYVSDRHRGIGGDGIVLILPSEIADFKMRMFNADGSEAQMCGNASRCVAKYLYENRLTEKTSVLLETRAGIKRLDFTPTAEDTVEEVTVDMGAPRFDSQDLPRLREIEISGRIVYPVSMGNPHGVTFVDEITDNMVLDEGPQMEIDTVWPEKANIEFVKVTDRSHIEMRVWERGTGETLACGTGACASAVASHEKGLTDDEVEVKLRGGTLRIKINPANGHVMMTGPARMVARGEIYY